jgi:tRNA pseudouridine32 synthase/23S rRNA pseudouridine746 synthase
MSPRPPRKVRAHEVPIQLTPEEIAFVRSLVIYEDEVLLALNKPSGLSSQGGRAQVHTLDEMLWAFARPGKSRPRLIHRLDRDTSGVILTAKTKPAAGFLGKAMMARQFAKTYRAIVAPGAPEPPAGVVETALRREEIGREAYMRVCAPGHPDAEAARTRYRTLGATPAAALVELEPETGRMHQLRVHLASSGRPIAGDARYGGALAVAGHAVPRLMLHAGALVFPHPAGGLKRLEAATPPDMAALAAGLGLEAVGTAPPPDRSAAEVADRQ